MKELLTCIEELRLKIDRHKKDNLKEYPTRTIFIDPLLKALGWDVTDPDDVQLEFPTIDGKSVDYAPKVNRKPVLFLEAKALNDLLTDIKSITQVVGYAANAGVEWCILTNGVTYKVYRSTEKAEAPNKLLFEVSIDTKQSEGKTLQQIAEQLYRFSRVSMERGVLDEIGEQVFTTGKVRKALDKLFLDPPPNLINLIRSTVDGETLKPVQIKAALKRLWSQSSINEPISFYTTKEKTEDNLQKFSRGKDYGEEYHLEGKPQEIVEIYRAVDKFCRELKPEKINKKYLAMYISYLYGKAIFCSVHLQKSGLRIWLKLKYTNIDTPPEYVRDVSKVGHWGVGDVEISLDNIEKLQYTKMLITKSFEENK